MDEVNVEKRKSVGPLASISDVFAFGNSSNQFRPYRFFGIFFAVVSGCLYPAMAFYWAKSFEDLGATHDEENYMKNIRHMAYVFLILGAISFVSLSLQSSLLELAASHASFDLKTKWFESLLRQDMAYYDMNNVSGQATIISTNSNKFKRGIGRKFGEGIQFSVTVIGGFIYSFYSSWKVSLVVLALLPLMAAAGYFVQNVTTKSSARASENYVEAGEIVYTTVSSMRTILSLNAPQEMMRKFQDATEKAYKGSTSFLVWVGLANGGMMASFLASYIAVTLYGSYLLYEDVRKNGCDPSGSVSNNTTCTLTGIDVFGALMGISFGAMGIPQITSAIEAFVSARIACYPAIIAINRKTNKKEDYNQDIESQRTSIVPLPKYVIDSSSADGKKPSLKGDITFQDVSFSYPTRAETLVLNSLSMTIKAGETVAFVGGSGSGKSTIIQLLERFYDVCSGSITIDNHDLRDLNVSWLRENIGLVGQEPTLFPCSIKDNISFGSPGVTQEEIETAAKAANAHDFITNFTHGYDTHVGDQGKQLSGGQKQRVALARVLIKNPKILLLDEATSALDYESERIVQQSLDEILSSTTKTTIIIAHRLSTIKNADIIAVLKDGKIVESGTHEKLLEIEESEYKKLFDAQSDSSPSKLPSSIISKKNSNVVELVEESKSFLNSVHLRFENVHFSYPRRPNNLVLKGLNLSVKKGETVAICGTSGGGKSTIIQLIERFYDPSSGTIKMDGHDLKNLNVQFLRNEIGLVSQEPTLFNMTIRENIIFGNSFDISVEAIEDAAKKANAHDFIMKFPKGYDTQVGETGTQVSGGQKQRISIARAILNKPNILLLDEATSALDSESEKLVQGAINDLIATKSQTVIVIAHRLSTIRNADRIVVLESGKVAEIGSHEELMTKNGVYKRLKVALSQEKAETAPSESIESIEMVNRMNEEENKEPLAIDDKDVKIIQKKNASRARLMAKGDASLLVVGSIGAIFSAVVFPGWGFAFAYMIELLYKPIFPCESDVDTCKIEWNSNADDLKNLSINITYGWISLMVCTIVGNMLLFYGFGTSSEKINRRVRDSAFNSLLRQEIGFFDMHTVGNLCTQIEEDAAMIHSFSGEPVRALVVSLSSVAVGLLLALIYMWPFALLTLAILPFMAFGAEVEMKMYMGEDEGVDTKEDENSAGAIVVETLLHMRTIASMSMERIRYKQYVTALKTKEPISIKANFVKGSTTGLGFLAQLWGMALMFWWGGYLLWNYPNNFSYRDFLISMFSLLFSLSGLTVATTGATNREKSIDAAKRIFDLIDKKSAIDSLSNEGLCAPLDSVASNTVS